MISDSSHNNRKRGGQTGNQNARKHGFYSNNLSPVEISQVLEIINLEDIDPVVAVLRVKLQSFLQKGPVNRRVLKEFSCLFVKCYSTKYQLDRVDCRYLKTVIESIFEHYLGKSFAWPEKSANPDG